MTFQLSEEGAAFVKRELNRYEDRHSAIIPALYCVQKENHGWVSPEAVTYLSHVMDLPETEIEEVLKFYTMFNKEPIGHHHVQVCCNISCAMNGGRELADRLCKELNIQDGEISKDGRFTIARVECLGACDKAPMMQVDDKYYEDLTEEKAIEILRQMK